MPLTQDYYGRPVVRGRPTPPEQAILPMQDSDEDVIQAVQNSVDEAMAAEAVPETPEELAARTCTHCEEPQVAAHHLQATTSSRLCMGCYYTQTIVCRYCNGRRSREDFTGFEDPGNGSVTMCNSCHTEQVTACQICESPFIRANGRRIGRTDQYVCRTCTPRLSHCRSCGGRFLPGSLRAAADGTEHCEECLKRYIPRGSLCLPRTLEFVVKNYDGEHEFCSEKVHRIEMGSGFVDAEGIMSIQKLLANHRLPYIFPPDFDWSTVTKQGRVTTRIAKWMKENAEKKLPKELISEIGNLAAQHTCRDTQFNVLFTSDVNGRTPSWYLNSNSCWWQSSSFSRCAFKEWSGFCIAIMPDDDPSKIPLGRCWAMPMSAGNKASKDFNDPLHFLFNVYSINNRYTLADFARILAFMRGGTYRRAKAANASNDHMYINGKAGYVVGPKETIRGMTEIHANGWRRDCKCKF